MAKKRKVNINKLVDVPVEYDLKKYAKKIMDLKGIQAGLFDFNFIGAKRMLSINKEYLNHNYVTDIITFNLADEGQDIIADIYICVDQAREQGHSLDEEIKLLMVHGILHLLGYDDQTDIDKAIMDKEQLVLLERAG